jgi:hypothetical protein
MSFGAGMTRWLFSCSNSDWLLARKVEGLQVDAMASLSDIGIRTAGMGDTSVELQIIYQLLNTFITITFDTK